ncbi:MAG: enoyl-CoA hydratase-related protein [Chloroflexota bacterium]|nr:enoyl-CoA hydratase-related protein [Chloroflexota bacterium]
MPTGFGWDFKTQYKEYFYEHNDYREWDFQAAVYDKVNDRIARITLNRPDKRNAFNDCMYEDIGAALHKANDDPEVRVVIIRGAGKHFGAGHDLSSPEGEESPPVHPSVNPTLQDYYGFERRRCYKYDDARDYPKITIAQVHGKCIGASQIFAASCDIIIAAEDAQFGIRGFGSQLHGLTEYPLWPLWSNKAYAGHAVTEMSGKETVDCGFANKAVKLEELEKETLMWAETLSHLPSEAVAVTNEWISGMLDIMGMGGAQRAHYHAHTGLQYVRFRPEEVNMYKDKRDKGLKGFLEDRAKTATATSHAKK